LFNKA
jgi:cell growth-regulating nucleolar protein